MFCYQCQETIANTGCTKGGACGKKPATAELQDMLVYLLQGLAVCAQKADRQNDNAIGLFTVQSLFATITNANFDDKVFVGRCLQAIALRDEIKSAAELDGSGLPDCAVWSGETKEELLAKAQTAGVLATENEDLRSLGQLVVYGLKGIAAYADHAAMLGHEDPEIYAFVLGALAAAATEKDADRLTALVLETGGAAVKTMALLDKANTDTYGHPEITKVRTGTRQRPAILISGHDLRDLEELLIQTENAGVDVYTHSEMLPAHYYPAFKKYEHFVGNYGNAWWKQNTEFADFNGPILMTTNCITPVQAAYKERIFTTGMAGYPGVKHIPDRENGAQKDFSKIIELAKICQPPTQIEDGEIVGGFAHNQVLALADKVVEAVKSGAIKRFVVMAGCDGRHPARKYFSDVAEKLPADTVILTAGCAKYRYNKLDLGDIGGIPRVLDAGQCNDSYSLAVVALKLKEVFGLADINDLPLSFDIAWYEQKAVAVLLALLHLGVKGIRLGPTLPAFLSPNVVNVLVDKFAIKPTAEADADVAAIMQGK